MDITDVVREGLCIGCGVCAAQTKGQVFIETSSIGMRSADIHRLSDSELEVADRVCPFSDACPSEDDLAERHSGATNWTWGVGRWDFAGFARVENTEYLRGSSSGGLTSFLLSELLRREFVDAVVHVGTSGTGTDMFSYQISSTPEALVGNRKSQYYSVSLEEVLLQLRGDGRKYALVGVPCFLKAVRSAMLEDAGLADQLKYLIGLVCGHLKTRHFAEAMALQVGVQPVDLARVDFRVKDQSAPAWRYQFGAKSLSTGSWKFAPTADLVGGNWGHAAFQAKACNFCDDIFAETADICFGDAWLPEFDDDWRGTNVLVSRSPELTALLVEGARTGRISLLRADISKVLESQAGNFRHRHDGLQYRLWKARRQGKPVPVKRLPPKRDAVSSRRRRLLDQRDRLTQVSISAYSGYDGDDLLAHFLATMRREISRYRRYDQPSVWIRAKRAMRAVLRLGNSHR